MTAGHILHRPQTKGAVVLLLLFCCRERHAVVEKEVRITAYHVARKHAGRFRKDTSRNEFAGVNEDTWAKYVHIISMWFDFCLAQGLFDGRWALFPLSEGVMVQVACHFFHYSGRKNGLSVVSLQQYLRMLVHVLVFMGKVPVRTIDPLHDQQFDIIQRVVNSIGIVHPVSRAVRNKKAAWDWQIVDAGLKLLLQWNVHGHCHLHTPAWPAYARLVLCLFNYLGWRPVSFTHKPGECASSPRWGGQPVLSFGECALHWDKGRLVAVQFSMLRTKFKRNPLFEACLDTDALRNRRIGVGKLTYSDDVDTCPVLAWLVWAVLNGVFGYAPWVGSFASGAMGHCDRLQCAADMTGQDVDALVDSIFDGMPSMAPEQTQGTPLMTGRMLHGGKYSITTTQMSRCCTAVGIRLGLNPRKCSAISGRMNVSTAVTNHAEATQMDAAAALQHAQPLVTTFGTYADAMRRCNDTTALVRGQPIRNLPGSVQLAHDRNLAPDVLAGVRAGRAARQLSAEQYASRCRRVPAAKVRLCAQNAYNKAFKAEMQRQFDAQARQPRGGNTNELLEHWFFQPYDCAAMSPAAFVCWQVKQALNLL
jgi:hypothetical protein